MTDSFDPYYKWLGIPSQEQPPNHYRLLGLQAFEADADVIVTAVDGRMAQIKRFQSGPYSQQSQQLLNEIAVAKVCLLSADKKAEYDLRLREKLEAEKKPVVRAAPAVRKAKPSDADADDALPSFATALPTSSYSSATRRKSSPPPMGWKVPAMFVSAAVVALAVILYLIAKAPGPNDQVIASGGGTQTTDPTAQPNPATKNPTEKNPDPAPATGGNPTTQPAGSNHDGGTKPIGTMAVDSTPPDVPDYPPLPDTTSAVDDPNEDPDPATSPDKTPSGTAEQPAETPAGPKKPAVPDDDQRKAAEKKIREIFQKDFAGGKGPKERLALAEKLAAQVEETRDDAAAQYALLCLARDLASGAGDLNKAMDYAGRIGELFDADPLVLKASLLEDAVKAGRSGQGADAAQIGEIAGQLADESIQADNFDMAQKFVKVGQAVARKVKDAQMQRDLTAREGELKKLKTQYAAVVKAQESLAADPADAEANLWVGRWLCCGKGQWEKGLPLLKKGSDANLADLAARDLESPKDAKQQLALADAWFALGEKDTKGGKRQLEARAMKWYEEAIPNLTGLDKTRVEKRVEGMLAGGGVPSAGRGAIKTGNVALASNGAQVAGPGTNLELLIDGNANNYRLGSGYAYATCPCEWLVTLDKTYQLQEIRVKLYDMDGRGRPGYRFSVGVSPDGQSFGMVGDHSQEDLIGWQRVAFKPRPVKVIKFIGLPDPNIRNAFVHAVEIEAYCIPPKN